MEREPPHGMNPVRNAPAWGDLRHPASVIPPRSGRPEDLVVVLRPLLPVAAALAACAGIATTGGLAASQPAATATERPALTSAWHGKALTVSNRGAQRALVFVSGEGSAGIRVTIRNTRNGRTFYSGTLAGLQDRAAGALAAGATRSFTVQTVGSGRVTLRWTAV
jgi:hypothetical protein